MTEKLCNFCKISKNISEFSKNKNSKDRLQNCCKNCAKINYANYYLKNKEKLALKAKEKFILNREKSLSKSRDYHYKNKEKRNSQAKAWWTPERREEEKIRKNKKRAELNEYQRNYAKDRSRTDPLFKFKKNIRRATSEAFSKDKKSKKTMELLGCSLEQAYFHIESLFQTGMSWNNYGEWHIDHKIPLASAISIEDTEKLCHYSNLQPLWALENILKSDKLDWKSK